MKRTELVVVGLTGRLGSSVARNLPGSMTVAAGIVSADTPIGTAGMQNGKVPLLHADGLEGVLKGRVVVDCSSPEGTSSIIGRAAASGSPVVIAATGHSESQLQAIRKAAERIPVVLESNFSVGIAVLRRIVELVFPLPDMFDLSIVERHNSSKKDAPSGTAKDLAARISERYGGLTIKLTPGARNAAALEILSVRAGKGGGSEHRILAEAPNEEIELRHTTMGSLAFVDGIVRSIEWVAEHRNENGLYSLSDLISA